jgi:hypothetical protein
LIFKQKPTIEQPDERWKYLGNQSLRYQIFSAYFDDRLEVVGKFRKREILTV